MISLDVFEKTPPLVAVFLACYIKFNKELGQVSVARHTKVLSQITPCTFALVTFLLQMTKSMSSQTWTALPWEWSYLSFSFSCL